MKKQLLSALLLLAGNTFLYSQTVEGLPESFRGKYGKPKNYHEMPAVNADQQIMLDEQRRIDGIDKMFRFGVEHAVSVDILAQAEKKTLPGGDVLYQYAIYCPGALSINVIFDRFELAEGTLLYIAAADGNSYAGAYTSLNNNDNKSIGTEMVYDQKAIIELREPKGAVGKSLLHLSTVVHGYRDLEPFLAKALGQAGNCNVDVNCPLGIGWEMQRNSVACVVNGGGACSGSLVNNTSGTIIPYYLSANHCGTNPTNWVFRFRWERTAANAICATANSTANNGPTTMTVTGGSLKAASSSSDFILVQLNTAPNPAWGIYYNGWDRSDALTVTQATGIHHPSGDIKKMSRENDPLTQQVTPFNGNQNTNVWRVANWDQGVTEPGSSGSPLFDQNHRTIGVLSGGTAACSGTNDNGGYDIYGRFGTAWNLGSTPATRLKEWLDPGNAGPDFIDGVDPAGPTNVNDAGLQNSSGVEGNICGASVTPQITLFNAGTSPLTSAVISYGFDGSTSQTYNWTGNLAQFANATIVLPTQTLTAGNHTFNAVITSANGTADEGAANNSITSTFSTVINGEIITLNLNLDRWASETSWQLLNASNNVLYSGGDYPDGPSGTVTPVTATFCLSPGCYTFKIMDTEGDGLTSNDPPGSYTITNNSGSILAQMTTAQADFGYSNSKQFCITSSIGIEEYLLNQNVSLFPNPAENIVNISVSGNASLQQAGIYNVAGQLLSEKNFQENAGQLDVTGLARGMYVVKIHTSQGSVIRTLVIK